MSDFTILSARRTQLFDVDGVRLTMLGTAQFRAAMTNAFGFQLVDFGDLSGQAPATFPPGVIFQRGEFVLASGQVVPIRVVGFEATQAVIDVAGDSGALDQVVIAIASVLGQFTSPDGNPLVGEPTFEVDASEISGRFEIDPTNLMRPDVAQFLRETHPDTDVGHRLIPYFFWNTYSPDLNYNGLQAPAELGAFQMGFRAGSPPSAGVMFSSAPLRTDKHISFLNQLRGIAETK